MSLLLLLYCYCINENKYYLFNSRLTYDGVNNPLQFNTRADAMEYLKSKKCPQTLPFVDLVSRKKTEDVSVSFQRECNRKIAPNLFDLDILTLTYFII